MKSESLTPVDTAWLHMEDPTNLMVVTGVLTFDGRVDFERFKTVYGERLLRFDRFRQRVEDKVLPLQAPQWRPDPHFDLDAHIHHIALPDARSRDSLMQTLGDLASTPLDFSKPLWQVHLIKSYRGNSLAVMRFHHAIGDGAAMVRVTYGLMDDPPAAGAPSDAAAARGRGAGGPGLLGDLLAPAKAALSLTGKVARTVTEEAGRTLAHPSHVFEIGSNVGRGAAVLGHALALGEDAKTPLKGPLGTQKHVALSAPVALSDIKRIGRALDAKVNDVLLSSVAGALRHYLARERGVDVSELTIRAVVPVDLRHAQSTRLGNEFGVVFLDLPLGIEDPVMRLKAIHERMNRLKTSPEPYVFFWLLNTFGMTPKIMEEQMTNLFGSKATLVMTNVMGPATRLHFDGTPVEDITFWVPQSGRLGLGVSIMSYAGRVTVGVISDAGLVPEPAAITARVESEFASLLQSVDGRAS